MSRHDEDRLTDIIEASDAISRHLLRGDFSDELVVDAVRVRLIEIGESVKEIDPNVLKLEPAVAWRDAAAMRDWLAHLLRHVGRGNRRHGGRGSATARRCGASTGEQAA